MISDFEMLSNRSVMSATTAILNTTEVGYVPRRICVIHSSCSDSDIYTC